MMAKKSENLVLTVVSALLTWILLFSTTVSSMEETTIPTSASNSTIKCYQCNSWSDEGCADLKANGSAEHYLQECNEDYEGDKPFCRKTVQAIKGHTARVIRACGWMRHPEHCYHTDDDHHIENVCQCYTDACNQAPSRRHDVIFLLVVAGCACVAALM